MDNIDRFYIRAMGDMYSAMSGMSEDDIGDLLAQRERHIAQGTAWIEENIPVEHGDIVDPMTAVLIDILGDAIDLTSPIGVTLSYLLYLMVNTAVAKGYEKGRREALAAMVLTGVDPTG